MRSGTPHPQGLPAYPDAICLYISNMGDKFPFKEKSLLKIFQNFSSKSLGSTLP